MPNRGAQRADHQEDDAARERRDDRDHQEEADLVHAGPEAAEIAAGEVAGEARREPDAHHHRDGAGGRYFRDERETGRRDIKLADGQHDEIGGEPEPARLATACAERRGQQNEVRERDAEAAERHLGDGGRLAAAIGLRPPHHQQERCEGEDHEGVERLKPGDRDLSAPDQEIDGAVGEFVGPQRDGVALLLVGRPEEGRGDRQQQERADRPPFVAAERLCGLFGGDAAVHIWGQCARGVEIDQKPDGHADPGCGEAVVPAEPFAQRAADQWGEERAEIDADVEDREGAVSPRIAGRIERADLRRDVRLERAVAEDQHGDGQEEQGLEGHQEVPDRHQRCAEHDGAALAEHAVGEQAAEDRREVNETSVEPVDVRGKRLHAERPEDGFQRAPECGEADHVLGAAGMQQVLHHVEHQQRLHAVIGEALPHFDGEEISEAAGMAEEVVVFRRRGHGCSPRRGEVSTACAYPNRLPCPGSPPPGFLGFAAGFGAGALVAGVLRVCRTSFAVAPTLPSANSMSRLMPGCTAVAARSGWPAASRTSAKPRSRTLW